MAVNVQNWWVEMYRANVFMQVQRLGSLLRKTVTIKDVTGRSAFAEGLGPTQTQELTTRNADTPTIAMDHVRRQLVLRDFNWGTLLDKIDKIRMLAKPENKYAKNAYYAFGRTWDDIMIEALLGPARSGMEGDTIINLPTEQKIGISTNVPMSMEVLEVVQERFKENNVPPNMPKYFLIGPRQERELLADERVASSDFNTVKVLVNANVREYMGFTFIVHTGLEKDADDKRHCIAYTQQALETGIGADPFLNMAPRPDKNFNNQLYMEMSLGAVRLEEKQVVEAAMWEDPAAYINGIQFEKPDITQYSKATMTDKNIPRDLRIEKMYQDQLSSVQAVSDEKYSLKINRMESSISSLADKFDKFVDSLIKDNAKQDKPEPKVKKSTKETKDKKE